MKRRALLLIIAAVVLGGLPVAGAATSAVPCRPRLLVLAPTPVEIGPLFAQTRVTKTVVIDGRQFFVGTLKGKDVILVLTGIGLVNAEHTTRVALDTFGCRGRGIKGIVLSGTSGGHTFIGDVTVPARWTKDGKAWSPTDPRMLATAKQVVAKGVPLLRDAPLGDCACTGADPNAIKPVHMPHAPQILLAGNGRSSDPFQGHAMPCVPQGGDVFGCQPCRATRIDPSDGPRFVTGAATLLTDPNFITGYFQAPPSTPAGFDADDMETAAVAQVAAQKKIPFIGFRSLSDGLGDPLNLPGFPAQFFVYRQYAADNAAAVAMAFLAAWSAH
jgi:nucleoside phosphorylase